MSARDASRPATKREETSYDDLLSAEETYEGSKHFALDVDVDFEADVDTASMNKTVVMSPALLAQLRAELLAQAAREPLHTRPTQRTMPAIRPDVADLVPGSQEAAATECARG